MGDPLAPLRDEHRHLRPHIDALRVSAEAVGSEDLAELRMRISDDVAFLTRHLAPHAMAEDAVLYPVVAEVLGAPEATATMQRDHAEVGRLTAELAMLGEQLDAVDTIGDDLANDLRRVLYGLHALINVHFAKEEEIYVPILEQRLDAARAEALIAEMSAVRA